MGNSVSGSKDRNSDESVDFGSLTPQGVYTGSQDWNQQVVGHLVVDRKLAPFYRPLEDYDESWDDDHILAVRKENPNAPPPPLPEPPVSASSSATKFHHHRNPNKAGKEPFRPTEASVYRGAVECPICFLYYPPNINRSRCCDQSICTECFVQIKRADPTPTHLVSEPASCPYCMQENFGVTYEPPPWRTGLMKEGQTFAANSTSSTESERTKRRKSLSADSPDVVTIDHIRPDWEAKLAAVRAAVTRRANRRIVMRQVGDRLIPIGITSGRVIAEGDGTSGNAEGGEGGPGRRSRRRAHGGQDLNQLLGTVGLGGLGGQDLEELMVMEAMRLSLMEHEEQQRRQNSNGNNDNSNNAAPGASSTTNGDSASPASSASASPRPSLSPPRSSSVHVPRSASPGSTPVSTPPRQSPLRTRMYTAPSPLGNANTAVSDMHPGSAPPDVSSHPQSNTPDAGNALMPPVGRAHRRTGSTPQPPSGSTLAAALSAVQTASAVLGSGSLERRQGQAIPRSAPETRAGSPRPSGPEQREGGSDTAVATSGGEDVLQGGSEAPPVVVEPSPEVETAASGSASSSPPVDETATLTASPAPLVVTPASEVVEGNTSSRDATGYMPLASSMESSSDPLLGWDK